MAEVLDPRYHGYPTDVEPNDPHDDLEGDDIEPIWPDTDSLALVQNARMSYDRRSDSLLMRFSDTHRATFNMQARTEKDYTYLLVDLETNEVVGFEIQKFLLKAVRDCPHLVNALDDAELRGITPDEVLIEKLKVLSRWTLLKMVLRHQILSLTSARRQLEHPKRRLVVNYYRDKCERTLA